jgi:hypothetical protein
MIKGTYIFYEDGKEIARHSNVITKFGKRFLTNFLAGNVSFTSKELALGIANGSEYAVSDSNSRLGFEFYRVPVEFGTTNIQSDGQGGFTYSVIYKSTLPQTMVGKINEIGLYPGNKQQSTLYSDKFISDFENNLIWSYADGSTPDIVQNNNVRIGSYLINLTVPSSSQSKVITANTNSLDISGYSVQDSLTLAYYQADSHLSSISARFYSSDTDYFQADFTTNSSIGNKIVQVSLANMLNNPTGSPDATAINKIGIVINSNSGGSSTIYLDGLRINDEDTFSPSYGIISRALISGGLDKVLGRTVDIEYRLELF